MNWYCILLNFHYKWKIIGKNKAVTFHYICLQWPLQGRIFITKTHQCTRQNHRYVNNFSSQWKLIIKKLGKKSNFQAMLVLQKTENKNWNVEEINSEFWWYVQSHCFSVSKKRRGEGGGGEDTEKLRKSTYANVFAFCLLVEKRRFLFTYGTKFSNCLPCLSQIYNYLFSQA